MDTTENLRREEGLAALKRSDAAIESIVEKAGYVSAYVLNEPLQLWSRADVEGALYLVKRSEEPRYRLIILNQKNPKNLVEDLSGSWEIATEQSYVFFRIPANAPGGFQRLCNPTDSSYRIAGLWFSGDSDRDNVAGAVKRVLNELSASQALMVPDDNREKEKAYTDKLQIPLSPQAAVTLHYGDVNVSTDEPLRTRPRGRRGRRGSSLSSLEMFLDGENEVGEQQKGNDNRNHKSKSRKRTKKDTGPIFKEPSEDAELPPPECKDADGGETSHSSTSRKTLSPGATILGLLGVPKSGEAVANKRNRSPVPRPSITKGENSAEKNEDLEMLPPSHPLDDLTKDPFQQSTHVDGSHKSISRPRSYTSLETDPQARMYQGSTSLMRNSFSSTSAMQRLPSVLYERFRRRISLQASRLSSANSAYIPSHSYGNIKLDPAARMNRIQQVSSLSALDATVHPRKLDDTTALWRALRGRAPQEPVLSRTNTMRSQRPPFYPGTATSAGRRDLYPLVNTSDYVNDRFSSNNLGESRYSRTEIQAAIQQVMHQPDFIDVFSNFLADKLGNHRGLREQHSTSSTVSPYQAVPPNNWL